MTLGLCGSLPRVRPSGFGLRLSNVGLIRHPCEESMHGVGDAGLKAWRQTTEFTLDGTGRNRERAMSPNCRPNLETRLSEAGILWIENDIGVQRIVRYAAGYEGQHDMTV
jgi:hypothetical protein